MCSSDLQISWRAVSETSRAPRRREIGSAVLQSCWALAGEQDVVAMFQAARDSEYEEILDTCRDFHTGLDKE